MRNRISIVPGLAVIAFMLAALSAINATAQDSSKPATPSDNGETARVSQSAPVQLSVNVWDVLKMVRSKITDDTVIAFINNSGKTYSLGASEIIYLRDQGASDRVITAMLSQRNATADSTAPVTSASAAPVPEPAPVQSSPVYVAPAAPAQAAPVYVAPPAPAYSYYPAYYYPYSGYYYPPVSLSFGFGFGGYYGGRGYYGGGYHGGGYHGGGYHGGGSHGGHH